MICEANCRPIQPKAVCQPANLEVKTLLTPRASHPVSVGQSPVSGLNFSVLVIAWKLADRTNVISWASFCQNSILRLHVRLVLHFFHQKSICLSRPWNNVSFTASCCYHVDEGKNFRAWQANVCESLHIPQVCGFRGGFVAGALLSSISTFPEMCLLVWLSCLSLSKGGVHTVVKVVLGFILSLYL